MDKPDELRREISRIEKDIEDLLEYRAEIFAHNRTLTGWAAFVGGFKARMAARQILRHLQYLRLQRETAYHSYESRGKTGQRGPV